MQHGSRWRSCCWAGLRSWVRACGWPTKRTPAVPDAGLAVLRLLIPSLCSLRPGECSAFVPSCPRRTVQVMLDHLLKHGKRSAGQGLKRSRLDGPVSVLLQCANLRPTNGVLCVQPTTASGPRWPPSGKTSLRMRTGYAWGEPAHGALRQGCRPCIDPLHLMLCRGKGPPAPTGCAHFSCPHWVWGAVHGLHLSAWPAPVSRAVPTSSRSKVRGSTLQTLPSPCLCQGAGLG